MHKPKLPFTTTKSKNATTIHLIKKGKFNDWQKKLDARLKNFIIQSDFKETSTTPLFDLEKRNVYAVINDSVGLYDTAPISDNITKNFSEKTIKDGFTFKTIGFLQEDINNACIGWALGTYKFEKYKKETVKPKLVWPDKADKKYVQTILQAVFMLRNIVNTPANDFTTDTMEQLGKALADEGKAKISITKGKKLEKEFPLIHMVGKAGHTEPRLLDIRWGKKSHPKLTLVGKGVCFDTGGLNIKPGQYMAHMKKDMGGAAHALATAKIIMALNLPVQLRVIIPTVENAISSNSFRPGDVATSRKGITVENTDTDAEGRLILADALALACEEKTDLLIDFATLTGSARAALGPDIPALFANNQKTGTDITALAMEIGDDPLWQMPLWIKYRKHLDSKNAEITNNATLAGDLIYSALFLKEFVDDRDWVHIDCYAWEQTGRAGRPSGAADTGLISIFRYLQKRYK